MVEEKNSEDEQKVSKYNSGVAIQIRIDGLWKDANKHSRLNLFEKWNLDLDAIWRELARDIKKDEWEDKKKIYEKFDTDLAATGKFRDFAEDDGFASPEKNALENRKKQYKLLNEKELFLKRLENDLGKGTAYEDEDEYDFD